MTEEKQDTAGEKKEPLKVSFSLPQITGGALAAATAAAIGSQLGVAGTILGAMVASIVGGVAGTLYSAGIDRTHRKVSDAIVRGYDRLRHDASYDPDELHPLEADGGATQVLPGLDDSVFRSPTDATRAHPAPAPGSTPRKRKPVWTVMALTAGAMFLVALVVITVVELGLGHSLGGGQGTTVGQVVPRSSTTPAPTATATATATATQTATTEPTATTETTATQSPTATATATTEPTTTEAPTASTTSVPAGNVAPTEPVDPAQPVG